MSTGRLGAGDTAIQPTIFDAKANLLTATAADTPAIIAVGANDTILTADSSTATGLKWAAPAAASFVGASIYNTASFTLANNTATRITMNTEFFDTDAFHDTSTNTARMTIPAGKGGKYLVCMGGGFEASGTGFRAIFLYKNNNSHIDLLSEAPTANTVKIGRSVIIDLVAGDFIELFAQQTSGGNLTGYFREYEQPFQIQFLGA